MARKHDTDNQAKIQTLYSSKSKKPVGKKVLGNKRKSFTPSAPNLSPKAKPTAYKKEAAKLDAYISQNNQANFLHEDQRKKIVARYQKATPSEKALIEDMLGKFETPEQVIHFFLGAHIELHGEGDTPYQMWKKQFGEQGTGALKYRMSSHVSADTQHAIAGPIVSEALFGTRYKDPNNKSAGKYTWIQLESHPVGGVKEWFKSASDFIKELINFFNHMVAFFDYRINKNNIGPYGKSKFIEKNPMVINIDKISPERQAENRKLWKEAFFEKPGITTPALEKRMSELNKAGPELSA